MKIGDLSRRTGLTAHTLRYYERIGLLPRASRDSSRQRDYDASILPWIEFIGRLRQTGMPVREMVRYATLRPQGIASEPEREALLRRHREHVRRQMAELQACLSVLDSKIAGYGGHPRMEQTDDADTSRGRKPLRTGPARPR
ncbi:MerR family transcriptional regulator [Roseomonas gilardii]|uniref:MerR family transcriptional regulator n=1 Tax=Roseomonas gilardii TaxID=257708 RepID=UPI0004830308|nr:MerR family transcriptional regulator [Roseomonas gilardii]SUE42907.1 HTH-type transcriptional regulator AdhR [Roseomonas gilardii subsp. rosea]